MAARRASRERSARERQWTSRSGRGPRRWPALRRWRRRRREARRVQRRRRQPRGRSGETFPRVHSLPAALPQAAAASRSSLTVLTAVAGARPAVAARDHARHGLGGRTDHVVLVFGIDNHVRAPRWPMVAPASCSPSSRTALHGRQQLRRHEARAEHGARPAQRPLRALPAAVARVPRRPPDRRADEPDQQPGSRRSARS